MPTRNRPTTVAFRIERLRDGYFVPVLIDDRGGEFRSNVCVCADQAAHTATRGRTRTLRYLGMTDDRQQPIEHDDKCSCDPWNWTWAHHGHTHGTLSSRSVTRSEAA